jgi:DNA-binding FrmR family transcriptional regulator
MLTPQKKKALKCFNQAMGTMRKIIEMIEKDSYCPDIIQQSDSVRGLITTAKRELLAGHLAGCLEKKLKEDKQKAIEELLKIYKLAE